MNDLGEVEYPDDERMVHVTMPARHIAKPVSHRGVAATEKK